MRKTILIVWLVAAGVVRGDIIQDEGSSAAFFNNTIGQTFVAVDKEIAIASVYLGGISGGSPGQPMDRTLTFTIYEGESTSGSLVAMCDTDNPPSGHRGWINCTFDPPIHLVPASLYLLWISTDTDWYLRMSGDNPYPQGASTAGSGWDLRFRILATELPAGSCCISDGCLEGLHESQCGAVGGTYTGDGRACWDNALTCDPKTCCTDVGCLSLTESACLARDDWQDWISAPEHCGLCNPPPGACCISGLCFAGRLESECLDVSADWAGPLTDCNACPPCEGPDFDGDGAEDDCDPDMDNDGVRNEDDVCDFTPLGLAVQANGTVPADLDGDCNVDLRDYALWQVSLTGP